LLITIFNISRPQFSFPRALLCMHVHVMSVRCCFVATYIFKPAETTGAAQRKEGKSRGIEQVAPGSLKSIAWSLGTDRLICVPRPFRVHRAVHALTVKKANNRGCWLLRKRQNIFRTACGSTCRLVETFSANEKSEKVYYFAAIFATFFLRAIRRFFNLRFILWRVWGHDYSWA